MIAQLNATILYRCIYFASFFEDLNEPMQYFLYIRFGYESNKISLLNNLLLLSLSFSEHFFDVLHVLSLKFSNM